MARPIHISATKLIEWGSHCACCLAPARKIRRAYFTRWEGVKVIRSTTKYWGVPYCRQCCAHQDAEESYQDSVRELRACLADRSWLGSLGCGIPLGALGLMCCPASFGLISGGLQDGPGVAARLIVGLSPLASLVASAAFILTSHFQLARRRERARALTSRRDAADSEVRSLLSDQCACAGPAVIYQGWNGSVQTFLIHNGTYYGWLWEWNRKKIV